MQQQTTDHATLAGQFNKDSHVWTGTTKRYGLCGKNATRRPSCPNGKTSEAGFQIKHNVLSHMTRT